MLSDCHAATALPPGFFSLNVPTGGGKTYASLAFRSTTRAITTCRPGTRHPVHQHHRADRRRLSPTPSSRQRGPGADRASQQYRPKEGYSGQWACGGENPGEPLVVTTNVQLYESLFASATTPCRKLHRIARSVIILDKAQTIPVELLRPTLLALKELVAHYGCTVVLCTATQPALEAGRESI